jgi:hypothetical protein
LYVPVEALSQAGTVIAAVGAAGRMGMTLIE